MDGKKFIIKKNEILKKFNISKKYAFIFLMIIILFLKKKNCSNKIVKNYSENNRGYKKSKFAILSRKNCPTCGLFSDFNVHLGCIYTYLEKGYIPIIDLSSFKNIFNGYQLNKSKGNPWELFFYQSFNYTLNDVKEKGKKIKYFECESTFMPSESIYNDSLLWNYWNNFQKQYMPIKSEIIMESNYIFKNLFKGSKNILGILMRGTDYTAIKPPEHPIPPEPEMVIKDINLIIQNISYEWYFLATEDEKIREKFKTEFGEKLKFLAYDKKLDYNYTAKNFLGFNDVIKGNVDYMKLYLLSIIILSQCLDIFCARTSGSLAAFILNNRYRYTKVYFLGNYP